MSAADARSLSVGICCPRTPSHKLISRDAAIARIPAVRRLSAAHHGLLEMPAACVLHACSLCASVR